MKNKIIKKITEYGIITVGVFIMSVAVVSYFGALDVVSGGVTGLAIIIRSVAGVPIWVINLGVNIPLFIAGAKKFKKEAFCKTMYATALLTIFLGFVPEFSLLTGDKLVDVICGGVLMGGGLGLVLLSGASSGGSDLLASLLNIKYRHLSVPKIMAVVDAVIVLLGASTFGLTNGVYSLIAVYLVSRVSDTVLEGVGRAKLIYIISESSEEIASFIKDVMDRGVTYIDTTGAFTGIKRNMIMCVVSSREMVKIKQEVYKIDSRAMCFVGDIREAFGEGFTKFEG